MKKNMKSRVFSRVLSHLAWANMYHFCGENDKAYKDILAAKRYIEDYAGDAVKVVFYAGEYHIQFTVYRYRDGLNRYYTVSASHGYVNDYHRTNRDETRNRIGKAEFERDCALRRDYRDYQSLLKYVEEVLIWVLTPDEYESYWRNGNINDIPYDVAIQLWRDLGECLGRIVNEAVAYRKDVL